MSKIWEHLTDWEKSPVRNAIAEWRIRRDIVALGDGNPYVKFNAVRALGEIAEKHPEYDWSGAVPALIVALGDGNSEFRGSIADALGKIAEKHPEYDWSGAVSALIVALGDGNPYVRGRAALALVKIGNPAVPALMEVFLGADRDASLKAYECLQKIGDPSLIPKLLEMLRTRDRSMRQALEILGATEPRNVSDWNELHKIGIEFKKENNWKRDIFPGSLERIYLRIISVHSKWGGVLEKRAGALAADKKFHVPKVEKPDKVERIMRVRRFCA